MSEDIIIRPYLPADRDAVRSISIRTAFLETPRGHIEEDDEILADVLTEYFTDFEPESCFVAVSGQRVVGYIIGTTDALKMGKVLRAKIIPALIVKIVRRGVLLKKKNLKFFFSLTGSFLKGEFRYPDFAQEFPAMLHINIEEEFRHHHIGARLIETYLSYLHDHKINGVHFGTLSEGGAKFFEHLGFALLFQGKRTYLRSYLGRDVAFYIFGKKLVP